MKRRRVTEESVFLLASIYGGVLGKCLPKKGVLFYLNVFFLKNLDIFQEDLAIFV